RIGLENHLNFIHRPGGKLHLDEAFGIAVLLSSSLVEQYFRIANGNTQVNATDIEALPLPSAATIGALGREAQARRLVPGAGTPEVDKLLWTLLTSAPSEGAAGAPHEAGGQGTSGA
ncbi:MAG: hypothetical protein ABL982_26500, partial [Vicinamibacterales bacterium]